MPFFKSRPFGQKVTVRLNPRYAGDTKRLIQMLAADDEDGKTRRAAIYEWLDSERPVLEVFSGFHHRLRIDGPAEFINRDLIFPMGSLLEAKGVCAHLDPIETKRIEERLRKAIDDVLDAWIAEHGLRDEDPPVAREIVRPTADPIAKRKIHNWLSQRRHGEPVDWSKADA